MSDQDKPKSTSTTKLATEDGKLARSLHQYQRTRPKHPALAGQAAPDKDKDKDSASTDRSIENQDLDRRRTGASIASIVKLQFPHGPNLQTIGGLQPMAHIRHLFINRAPRGAPHAPHGSGVLHLSGSGPSVYDIVDEEGHLVFSATVKRQSCFTKLLARCPRHFIAILSDLHGEEVLSLDGEQSWCGRRSSIRVRGRLENYGHVEQVGDCCTPDYVLYSPVGEQVLVVRPRQSVNCFNCCVPINYAIFHGQLATRVGKVKEKWKLTPVADQLMPEYFKAYRRQNPRAYFTKKQRKKKVKVRGQYEDGEESSEDEHYDEEVAALEKKLGLESSQDAKITYMRMYGVGVPKDMPVQLKVLVLATLIMIKIFNNQ